MEEHKRMICTLTDEDRPRREAEARALRARLREHWVEGERAAMLVFAPDADDLVKRFVRDESECCSFFTFDLDQDGEAVRLRVTAPEGGEPHLRQLRDALLR